MKVITVAAAIIINEHDQLLLVRKKNTDFFMQVGGKLEPHETPEQTMLREIQEEIGVQATIHRFVGRFETWAANEAEHRLVSYVYHVKLKGSPKIDAEIAAMKWLDFTSEQVDEQYLAPLTIEVVLPWCRQYLLENVL